jgi:hypothetical protein
MSKTICINLGGGLNDAQWNMLFGISVVRFNKKELPKSYCFSNNNFTCIDDVNSGDIQYWSEENIEDQVKQIHENLWIMRQELIDDEIIDGDATLYVILPNDLSYAYYLGELIGGEQNNSNYCGVNYLIPNPRGFFNFVK